MKALAALVLEAAVEAWYPPVPEGEKRKLRVNAAGVALLVAILGFGWNQLELRGLRAEVVDVKTTATKIWNALLERGIAEEPPTARPASATRAGRVHLLPAASAEESVP